MLTSGNDAALAIAESVGGGSIERFVGWMNERAETMGLVNTHFKNPHGLDQDGHYSSARDMAEIARTLMADQRLATIVGTRRYVVPGPPLYVFVTSNPILSVVPGADGVKTGFTDDAGRCFAGSAIRDGRRVISVVLNSPNIAAETSLLLDAGFAQSRPSTLGVPHAGFAAVRPLAPGVGDGARVHAIGWEVPFLRAFTRPSGDRGAETVVTLLGRPVSRWVS
jgi:D-alanyl-D-alanine carboxypeptidase